MKTLLITFFLGFALAASAVTKHSLCLLDESKQRIALFDSEGSFQQLLQDLNHPRQFIDDFCVDYEIFDRMNLPEEFSGQFSGETPEKEYHVDILADWNQVSVKEYDVDGNTDKTTVYTNEITTYSSKSFTETKEDGSKQYQCIYELGAAEIAVNRISIETVIYSVPVTYLGSFVCFHRGVEKIMEEGVVEASQRIDATLNEDDNLELQITRKDEDSVLLEMMRLSDSENL